MTFGSPGGQYRRVPLPGECEQASGTDRSRRRLGAVRQVEPDSPWEVITMVSHSIHLLVQLLLQLVG